MTDVPPYRSNRPRWFALTVAAALSAALSLPAMAQDYPARPITMVVPFPAGGSTDGIGRILADGMRGPLGQTIIIENVGGASGNLGVGRVARATPDGYSLILGSWPTHVLNAAIFSLPYDTQKDFEPISLVAAQPLFVVARKNFPANTLKELIAWLKANPGQATQGTVGLGGASHIAGVLFQKASGTEFRVVPYRGSGPAMQDLISGQIDLMVDLAASSMPQIRAGTIKAYAIAAKARVAAAPDVPTVDEAGLPGLYITSWHGIWAPKGTPAPIIAKLNAAAKQALADPQVRKRLADIGQDVYPPEQQTPEAMRAYQATEIERWWPIVKDANIKAN